MQRLWMKIDLSGARGKIPWTAMRSYIRRSKGMVSHAIIKNLVGPSTRKAIEFLSRCPRLEHLELWVTHDQKDIYEKFKGCKTLKRLILSADIKSNSNYLKGFLTELPRLECIELWDIQEVPMMDMDGNWPRYLPNLRSITLASRHSVRPGFAALFHPVHIPGVEMPDSRYVCLRYQFSCLSHYAHASSNSNPVHIPIWKNYGWFGTRYSIDLIHSRRPQE